MAEWSTRKRHSAIAASEAFNQRPVYNKNIVDRRVTGHCDKAVQKFRMFRNELFGGLKKADLPEVFCRFRLVDELQNRCLFFGRKRIHRFDEALAGHPDAIVTRARGGRFSYPRRTSCIRMARITVLDSMDSAGSPSWATIDFSTGSFDWPHARDAGGLCLRHNRFPQTEVFEIGV
jgi:hypothetical protein